MKTPKLVVLAGLLLVVAVGVGMNMHRFAGPGRGGREAGSGGSGRSEASVGSGSGSRSSSKSPRVRPGQTTERSKAWRMVAQLERSFPVPDSVAFTEAKFVERPGGGREQGQASAWRSWEIAGYANDEALEPLTTINTREGIRDVFTAAYERTGDDLFRTDSPDPGPVVNLLVSENKRFDPKQGGGAETQFPFMFKLTITLGAHATGLPAARPGVPGDPGA